MFQTIQENNSYYIVNNRRFSNKIDAVLAANLHKHKVEWYFNDIEFANINWYDEPNDSLDSLYARRAKELREKFDYLVVFCSGGADSRNVALSFLENNIHIDEIVASAPLSGLSNFQHNNLDTSHTNTMSETYYAQIPFIKEIEKKYSNVKITLHDYFQDILAFKTDDWLYRSEDWIHPSGIARYRLERHSHLVKLADSGLKIGFIYGIDKPIIVFKESAIFMVFSDLALNVSRPVFDRDYPNVCNVPFYWATSCATMLIKQAHTVARSAVNRACQVSKYITDVNVYKQSTDYQNRIKHSKYERSIIPIIYPKTYRPVFQAEKPTKIFLGEHDQWFYDLHKNTRTFEMIASDTKYFYKSINSMYLNSSKTGISTMLKFFYIGTVDHFKKLVSK